MNKQQLIDKLSENTGHKKNDIQRIVNQTFEIIKESVMNGEKVTITGFGSLRPVQQKQRNARNFQTGGTVTVPERTVPKFKPSDSFVQQLNLS